MTLADWLLIVFGVAAVIALAGWWASDIANDAELQAGKPMRARRHEELEHEKRLRRLEQVEVADAAHVIVRRVPYDRETDPRGDL